MLKILIIIANLTVLLSSTSAFAKKGTLERLGSDPRDEICTCMIAYDESKRHCVVKPDYSCKQDPAYEGQYVYDGKGDKITQSECDRVSNGNYTLHLDKDYHCYYTRKEGGEAAYINVKQM